jgi:hypothetical protein
MKGMLKQMFEQGVAEALRLLQDPRLREALRETLAKSAEAVMKAAKDLAKEAARAKR